MSKNKTHPYTYSIALNSEEQYRFVQVKSAGHGVKKIFMAGLDSLSPTVVSVIAPVNEEEE